MVAKNLLNDALALPAADRQELAERLWESLRDDPEASALTETEKALLDQRLAEMELYPEDEISIEELDAKLGEVAEPLSEGHRQILDLRLAEYEADPEEGAIWEEVEARILKLRKDRI